MNDLFLMMINTCKTYDGPDAEEADNTDNQTRRRLSHCVQKVALK